MRTELGKIQNIELGFGGYQDAQFGLSVTLGGTGWGVQDFKGTWEREPDQHCKWTKQDQRNIYADTMQYIVQLLKDANKTSLQELKNVPVEITFEDNTLKSWRILKEVL